MRYITGEVARVGDAVSELDGLRGTVVCSIDTAEYSVSYPKAQWSYLKEGIMIEFDQIGLVHYVDPAGLIFIDRGSSAIR